MNKKYFVDVEKYFVESEKYFVEGLRAARGGLAKNRCPCEVPGTGLDDDGTAWINWRQGWEFGRFTMAQTLRRDNQHRLQPAVNTIYKYQPMYHDASRVANLGLLRSRFKCVHARKQRDKIADAILSSPEYQLLADLQYEIYFPSLPREAPYKLRLIDRQLAVFGYKCDEDTFRKLLQCYGDQHGVKAAWHEYIEQCSSVDFPD